ncbi:23S rRNA (cytidine2498-2'-O)-methyltransferase [Enhydrobacter aerosaccus]|uniref:23S rRNA (Cytidine2498-2'-O)-methyltransferase n=1 Tax=Enhydrobacter aerosaccus TaxID=225324 RepID=A0A1T4RJP1_9HYPH|nr:SAM-dependent methyltransferase [Enhydrobacter aerosaccus]SKA16230.1 23S rRNA (cytidine2498-2'-O)-methyltransferase [Enhydrobacter aerosaccus]
MTSAYLAAEGFEAQLQEELRRAGRTVRARHGRLFICDQPAMSAAWAANTWFDCRELPVPSIGEAAKALRAIQRNWAMHAPLHYRRAALIQERLPHVSAKPIVFPAPAPTAPLGSWTLLAPDRMLAAARCSSPFPNGEVTFVEDKAGPPSRAYLKLWEALVRLRRWPQPGERCIDLGASPGGWTYVLGKLGTEVIAIDKAPLDPKVMAMPGVQWRGESAFALEPHSIGPVDWLFSDVICYPARLLRLVERWRASGLVRNFVCTIKFQGETDHDTAAAFAALPGARVMHLHHNKHELTFMLEGDGAGKP